MDLLCLMLTASLLHRFVLRLRAVGAAVLGGIWAVAALLLGLGGAIGVLLDCLVALLMCAIGFHKRNASFVRLLRITAVYVLISMMLGGIMTGLYALLNRLNLPLESLQGDGLSVWSFALLCAVASFFTARGGRWFGRQDKEKHVTVTATLLGKTVTLQALSDSGNLLQDPLSGKSVIVADRRCLASVLPASLLRACRTGEIGAFLSRSEHTRFLRLIPTQTATGKGLLVAIVPDRLEITDRKETYRADYLVAIGDLGERAKEFDAIIALH